jgi:hypothetical protein
MEKVIELRIVYSVSVRKKIMTSRIYIRKKLAGGKVPQRG